MILSMPDHGDQDADAVAAALAIPVRIAEALQLKEEVLASDEPPFPDARMMAAEVPLAEEVDPASVPVLSEVNVES